MEIILGVGVSVLMEFLKKNFRLGGYKTLATVLGISLVASIVYTFLSRAGLLDTVIGVLTTAGAFYAFVLSNIHKGSKK